MSYLVKSNFITSCLAFKGSIRTNSYQPQKQTRYYRKNLLYSYVTFLYHPTTRYHLFFYMFPLIVVLQFFGLCHNPDNSTQTIQPMEIPISQKASFVAIEVTKTTQSVHIPIYIILCLIPYHIVFIKNLTFVLTNIF